MKGHNYDHGKGDICRKCGKIHINSFLVLPRWNKGLTKETDERLLRAGKLISKTKLAQHFHHSEEYKKKMSQAIRSGFANGRVNWNKGLTKETDERVRRSGIKNSITRNERKIGKEKNHYLYGKHQSAESIRKNCLAHLGKQGWSKGLTKETDARVMRISLKQKQNYVNDRRLGRIRRKIQKKDTSIELLLQKILREHNIAFLTHYPILGTPDIFISPNVCVFADGDYWHSFPHIQIRDTEVTQRLTKRGYKILRFSGSEIRDDLNTCFVKIMKEIKG